VSLLLISPNFYYFFVEKRKEEVPNSITRNNILILGFKLIFGESNKFLKKIEALFPLF
jgi:hypothetical protein